MACSTPIIIKDFFMKTDQELYGEDKNKSSSGFEKVARTPDDQQRDISLRSMDEENHMSQSVWFFRKYLLTRSQNNVAKTSMEAEFESEIIKGHSSPRPLPPKFLGSNNFPGHRLSLLEQQLLPGLRCDDQSNRTSEQLTIFYDGIINVYDNIPADKAQAIMRLASENSSVKPLVAERLKIDRQKPPLKPKSLSVSKIRAGLPMARRYSLQCFLEKRRGRNINNSPYALHSKKQEDNYEATVNNESNESDKLSLLPFPSRLGYFYPRYISAAVCGFREAQRRAISIEVGMQNSSLGVVLATSHFTSPMVALHATLSTVIMNIMGSSLAFFWRYVDPSDSKETPTVEVKWQLWHPFEVFPNPAISAVSMNTMGSSSLGVLGDMYPFGSIKSPTVDVK